MSNVRVLLAKEQATVRSALASFLASVPGIEVVGEVKDGKDAVTRSKQLNPDVAILDFNLSEVGGYEIAREIRKSCVGAKVVFLSSQSSEQCILEAFRAGASGYVLRDAPTDELVLAVRAVAKGGAYMSPSVSSRAMAEYVRLADANVKPDPYEKLTCREREVFQLIAEGHPNREVAKLLKISVKTVEAHRANLMAKLDMHSTAELARYAVSLGIVSADQ